MKYNFDEIVQRRGTDSLKWNSPEGNDVLPMWVADMDFQTLPEVIEALSNRAQQGIFGYNTIPDAFYEAIISWWQLKHNYNLKRDTILPTTGVISTLSAIIRVLTTDTDKVIVQTPAYNHFFILLDKCKREVVSNELVESNGVYTIDFEDLEAKVADKDTTVLILCNPHNPIGRAWTEEELHKIAVICKKHNVTIISDEIHADLVYKGNTYTPFQAIAEKHGVAAVSCASPCKTFNISSLQVSFMVTDNMDLKEKVQYMLEMQGNNMFNPFAVEALITAYTKGSIWVEELKDYLYDNYLFLAQFCKDNLPELRVSELEATYLVWLDCRALAKTSEELSELLIEEEKLRVNPGNMYGASGEGFLRINIACPRQLLKDGLLRLQKVYEGLASDLHLSSLPS